MSNSLKHGLACAIFAGVISMSMSAFACKDGENKDGPPRREPPPQAYEDCKGKNAGDKVEITTPKGDKISGTCTSSPKGLFARPEHPPGGKPGGENGQGGQGGGPRESGGPEGKEGPPPGGPEGNEPPAKP